jgi:hypothetical protein
MKLKSVAALVVVNRKIGLAYYDLEPRSIIGEDIVEMIHTLASLHKKDKIHIMWDNARVHHSKKV